MAKKRSKQSRKPRMNPAERDELGRIKSVVMARKALTDMQMSIIMEMDRQGMGVQQLADAIGETSTFVAHRLQYAAAQVDLRLVASIWRALGYNLNPNMARGSFHVVAIPVEKK